LSYERMFKNSKNSLLHFAAYCNIFFINAAFLSWDFIFFP